MKSLLAKSDLPATSVDIAWRVLALVNVFRLLVPLLLTLMFVTIKPSSPVGQAHPALFVGVATSHFIYAVL